MNRPLRPDESSDGLRGILEDVRITNCPGKRSVTWGQVRQAPGSEIFSGRDPEVFPKPGDEGADALVAHIEGHRCDGFPGLQGFQRCQ